MEHRAECVLRRSLDENSIDFLCAIVVFLDFPLPSLLRPTPPPTPTRSLCMGILWKKFSHRVDPSHTSDSPRPCAASLANGPSRRAGTESSASLASPSSLRTPTPLYLFGSTYGSLKQRNVPVKTRAKKGRGNLQRTALGKGSGVKEKPRVTGEAGMSGTQVDQENPIQMFPGQQSSEVEGVQGYLNKNYEVLGEPGADVSKTPPSSFGSMQAARRPPSHSPAPLSRLHACTCSLAHGSITCEGWFP